VKSGRATITDFKLIERLYPYERVGSFASNDGFLNRLWDMCARSCEVLSEDSYVDCADRERVEWMDDTPPGFDITRTAMAGPGFDGKPVYSDPRLLGALIRREALTLQPDGWVKAHTCSDRYDIHAKMEDRTCDWVEGERLYCDATGDTTILRQTWPAIVAQMNYFLDRRTPRGLVSARDWVVWGNPTGYIIGEATTLNVFVQRALVDAAYLARLDWRRAIRHQVRRRSERSGQGDQYGTVG
jgi:alpha-L-rhamnosidase